MGRIILLLGICALASSCSLGSIPEDVRRLQVGMNDLRTFQAEQTTKIAGLETQVRQLSGRVEELEYAQKQKLGVDLNDLKSDLSELRRRVPPPTIVPALLLEADENGLGRSPAELTPLLRSAFQGLREGKFSEAEDRLKEALELARGTQWAADIVYWIGVCRDGQGQNREALQAYHSVVADYPKHRKAAAALLRQAEVFERLGDAKTAKTTLKKLVVDYPKAEEATRAKQRLKDL